MMQNISSSRGTHVPRSGWVVRAIVESTAKSLRCFVALMKEAAAHEQDRRHLARFDERMLQDIGLEPFDVYYGWCGSSRR